MSKRETTPPNLGLNKDGTPKKDGRGKPAGTKDTVTVGREFIEQLFEHGLKGIEVRRKWVKDCEKFYGVKFVEPSAPVVEGAIVSAKDAAPRERLIVKEEEL